MMNGGPSCFCTCRSTVGKWSSQFCTSLNKLAFYICWFYLVLFHNFLAPRSLAVVVLKVSTQFRVLGIKFSDKSLVYLGGLQLLLSSWRRSILPGICGIVVGFLYRMNVFGIQKAKFPASVSSFFSRFLWLSSTSPPASSLRSVFRNFPSTTAQQGNYTSVPSTVEPSEEYTATLVSMGFNRDSARQVLVEARNDVNAATNILLEAQSQ